MSESEKTVDCSQLHEHCEFREREMAQLRAELVTWKERVDDDEFRHEEDVEEMDRIRAEVAQLRAERDFLAGQLSLDSDWSSERWIQYFEQKARAALKKEGSA